MVQLLGSIPRHSRPLVRFGCLFVIVFVNILAVWATVEAGNECWEIQYSTAICKLTNSSGCSGSCVGRGPLGTCTGDAKAFTGNNIHIQVFNDNGPFKGQVQTVPVACYHKYQCSNQPTLPGACSSLSGDCLESELSVCYDCRQDGEPEIISVGSIDLNANYEACSASGG